ncbi:hypothetical protein [Aeromonas veronii]|uniref:hypothetical protein n=1 Tax=Aeromonas veronii TaxID=654 RepID=UPI002FC32B0B
MPIPFQARAKLPTVPVHSADGRPVGRRHIVDRLTPVAIDQSGTIRCVVTGRSLFNVQDNITDNPNLGAT